MGGGNRSKALTALAFCALSTGSVSLALAAEMPTSSSALTLPSPGAPNSLSFFRLSLLSSRSERDPDYRSMKGSGAGGDDSGSGGGAGPDDGSGQGGGGPGASNSNYVAAFGIMPGLTRGGTFSFVGLQSLDPVENRTILAPMGAKFTMPGSIVSAKYEQEFVPRFSVLARESFINTLGFTDPSLGVSFRNAQRVGWSERLSLTSSVPLTDKSKSSGLVTRSALRGNLEHSWAQLKWYGSLGFSKAFYSSDAPSGGFGIASGHNKKPGLGQASASNPPNFNGAIPSSFKPDELDLVLLCREQHRSSMASGLSWRPIDDLKISAGGNLSLAKTTNGDSLWSSSIKPMGLTYGLGAWELGSDLSFNSDVADYKSPPLPKLWSLSASLSYTFGSPHARF